MGRASFVLFLAVRLHIWYPISDVLGTDRSVDEGVKLFPAVSYSECSIDSITYS